MKAVRSHTQGDHTTLVYEDAPMPQPGVGDVIVRVHAASFTPDELSWPVTWADRAGRDRTPSIPGHEVAGVVESLGFGTTGLAVGDRVFGLTDRHRDGAAAEFMAAEARDLAVLPESISFVDAAALPMTGLTAWQALFQHGRLTARQTVLIHGAAGGVGSMAVQLARDAGARVIGTGHSGSDELVLGLGADQFVDVDASRFEDVSAPVDLVFDMIGGETLRRSAAVVRPGGALVSIAAPPPVEPEGGRAVFFIVEPNRAQLTELATRVVSGRITPKVGAVYPLSETRAAFEAKRKGVPGKVVLKLTR
jgi:NADPH:quinone reductase-like Zn-dependent oxidoreductase